MQKEYIQSGDIFQVVLSQRLSIPFEAEPVTLYRALRTVNPSPYMYFLDLDDFQIVGSSPEILARLEDGEVTVRPIAGTRRRGRGKKRIKALEQELISDPKELAEHLMLVDLGRNDVGRISVTGSVKLTSKMQVERYSHVMHIVSNVTGELQDDLDAIDVLRATFPAGTVSGAPKVRAMEIINELEPVKRGIYSGAVGYIGWNGNMDTAIAIRTAVIADGELHIQAGAGIVADSIPANEWQETMNRGPGHLPSRIYGDTGTRPRSARRLNISWCLMSSRPNVLLLFSDEHRHDALGAQVMRWLKHRTWIPWRRRARALRRLTRLHRSAFRQEQVLQRGSMCIKTAAGLMHRLTQESR